MKNKGKKVILTEAQQKFRKEVTKLNAIANKRIKRLQESEYSSSPALKKWESEGSEFFSIRGKTQQEVWKEYYRVKSFLDSKTSSITGTKEVLMNINQYTGMQLQSVKEIQEVAPDYFRLANKVSEYVNNKGLGAIYDSNQVYNQINLVVEENDIDLKNADFGELLDYITETINKDYYLNQDTDLNELGFYKKLK